uniref:Methyltransferase n=1 Tax=Aegilops tauschii subsp. strangulata TaxID=200361 RepID=A0A452Z1B5_AEGTS
SIKLLYLFRLMRPGGIYMLITYGAPKERLTLLNQVQCCWEVELYIMPTPEYQLKWSNGAAHAMMEKVALTVDRQLPPDYVLKNPESHFIYVCYKSDIVTEDNSMVAGQDDAMTSF